MKFKYKENLLLIHFICFCVSCFFTFGEAALSDKRLCANADCSKIISLGTGKINYRAGEKGMVSFKANSVIHVMSKSAGSNMDLWGISVNGQKGYAPKELILENKIHVKEKELQFIVSVDLSGQTADSNILNSSEVVDNNMDSSTTAPLYVTSTMPSVERPILTSMEENEPVHLDKVSAVQSNPEIVDGTIIPFENRVNAKDETKLMDNTKTSNKNVSPVQSDLEIPVGNAIPLENRVNAKDETNLMDETIAANEKVSPVQSSVEIADGNAIPFENRVNAKDETKLMDKTTAANEKLSTVQSNLETVSTKNKVIRTNEHEPYAINENTVNGPSLNDRNQKLNTNEEKEFTNKNTTFDEQEPKVNANGDSKHNEKEIEMDQNLINSTNKNIVNETNSNDEQETKLITNDESKSIEKPIKKEENTIYAKDETADKELIVDKEMKQNIATDKDTKKNENNFQDESKITNNDSIEEKETKMEKTGMDESDRYPYAKDKNTINETTAGEKQEQININTVNKEKELKKNYMTESVEKSSTNLIDNDSVGVKPIALSKNEYQSTIETKDFKNTMYRVLEDEKSETNTNSNIVKPQEIINSVHNENDTVNDLKKGIDNFEKNINNTETNVAEKKVHNTEVTINKLEGQTSNVNIDEDIHQERTIRHTSDTETVPFYLENPAKTAVESVRATEAESDVENVKLDVEQQESYSQTKQPLYNEQEKHSTVDIQQPNVGDDAPLSPIPGLPVTENFYGANHQPLNIDGDSGQNTFDTSEPEKFNQEPKLQDHADSKEDGLFTKILGTVNNFLSSDKKKSHIKSDGVYESDELQRILYPEVATHEKHFDIEYCEKLSPNECPQSGSSEKLHKTSTHLDSCDLDNITWDNFFSLLSVKFLQIGQLVACLAIAATATLVFLFGYYCFSNSSREGALLSKLNLLERSLLATHKENSILKDDLLKTRCKLSSIENNSFGSNDMVISLKREIEEEILEKEKLQDHVQNLEKELENAAEAGLELNKIVAELISNQSGDESIINSVEELQKQLNEQQNTIMEINANLAEKSRENSELQIILADIKARMGADIAALQQDTDELEAEKNRLINRLEEQKYEFEVEITKALEGKNLEIQKLQNNVVELENKLESEHTKLRTSLAKVEALEDCLKSLKKGPDTKIDELINATNIRAELIDLNKQRSSLQERLNSEMNARKLAENQLKLTTAEVEKFKQDFNQSEKDKLEAQTRLEVLSNYFKEKETQLQKELNLKEAIWLKQQGEATSTVDRMTKMQEEVQTLKSQNEELRAEIEAQIAAHKAQIGTLENRAHESWLLARQSERRFEEARAEASVLRHKLTSLAGITETEGNNFGDGKQNDLNIGTSAMHLEPPGSPLLAGLPPPPFLPPPFYGPPPPFLGLPPPPFLPPNEMRPAPLGCIKSPPPSHRTHLRANRYSPHRDDDDYDSYDEYNEEDDEEIIRRRRRHSFSWQQDSYSPAPRTYRSHSPADTDDDHDIMRSNYDSETDDSPPQSTRNHRHETRLHSGSYNTYSPPPTASSPISESDNKRFVSGKKGFSSGSENSTNSSRHRIQMDRGKSMV